MKICTDAYHSMIKSTETYADIQRSKLTVYYEWS